MSSHDSLADTQLTSFEYDLSTCERKSRSEECIEKHSTDNKARRHVV